MTSTISAELVRRCEERRLCSTVTTVCAALGAAIDAGVIELGDLLDLVRSCNTPDELADALTTLAASAQLPVGCPPGHEHRVFRVVGEREGGDTWTR